LEAQTLLNYQLKNEVSWANFNAYKRIFNWQPQITPLFWCEVSAIIYNFTRKITNYEIAMVTFGAKFLDAINKLKINPRL